MLVLKFQYRTGIENKHHSFTEEFSTEQKSANKIIESC